MCGISGMISRRGRPDVACVQRMHNALQHRGPDGEGFYGDEHIVFRHRRLSIIDREGGGQPLTSEDGRLILIANGEIYNYIELRDELQQREHRFKTCSDCEVIVHLYEEEGPDCVHQLRGMFAFALWDLKEQRLVLARDRMGEKPLYYHLSDQGMFFASELKGLLASGAVPFQLDEDAVNLYFHYGYVPEPQTPIRGVKKLDAASLLQVDLEPWRVQESNYWRLEDAPAFESADEQCLDRELERVGELVLRSDVPVGVALSGGLDSSLVAALAAQRYPGRLHAFSVGYPGHPPCDERDDARRLANYLDIEFHEVELSTDSFVNAFPQLILDADDPIADIASWGYYSVMKRSAECGIPVMLQGQGGDELFWGYEWARRSVAATDRKQRWLRSPWRTLHEYLNPLKNGVAAKKLLSLQRVGRGMADGWEQLRRDGSSPPDQFVFYDMVPSFCVAAKMRKKLFTTEFQKNLTRDAADLFREIPTNIPIDVAITGLTCHTYLRENGIAQADRLSMASSVELRLPLVDYRLVEKAIGLRKNCPDHRLPAKARLRSAAARFLPGEFLRRKKLGFTPPLREWYGSVLDRYGSTLDNGYLVQAGILQAATARELASGECRGQDNLEFTFRALVLEMWCQIYSCLGSSHSGKNECSHRKVPASLREESWVVER